MTRDAAERLQAFQGKQEGPEVLQNRIARRIGDDGWLILGEMSDAQRAHLSKLERLGRLRVIVVEGEQRNPSDPKPKASVVKARRPLADFFHNV